MNISAVVLTKNEERNIADCLKTLQWCDEVIVVDDNSTDQTVHLARKLKAKVYQHSLDNNFSQQRNFGLSKVHNEWILFVDADERVSSSLRNEIIQYTNNPRHKYEGFLLRRLDSMWGRELKHGETGDIQLLRLAKRESGRWEGKVHEEWKITGEIGQLQNPLIHYPHQTITEFLQEINFYTTLRSQELFKKKAHVSFWQIIIYPKAKFFVNYFLKLGFLDGIPGLIFALFMSFHSFLVRGKLWQLWQKK